MNVEQLESRKNLLMSERQECHNQMVQLQSQIVELQNTSQAVVNNINAYNGAIQEIEHWMKSGEGLASSLDGKSASEVIEGAEEIREAVKVPPKKEK